MKIKNSFSIFVLTTVLCLTGLQAYDGEGKGRGLNPISQEALQEAEENWHAVVEVKPNKIGMERIRIHREIHGLPPLFLAPAAHGEEVTLVKGQQNAEPVMAMEESNTLPSSVDNSRLPSFPPIGDQQQLGSCVAWGTTYYQASHEYGLLNGINNKTSQKFVFSPKWTYNNLNGGEDGGLNIFDAYQLFAQNGFVSIENLPYDSNYLSWDLNPQDWISAISYRFKPGQLIAGIGGNTQNLNVIKKLLNNGHVLTFGTFINSWQMTKIKKDPSQTSNPHADELAAAWMSGTEGGHCMTIVGYDDQVWIDINNNGKVDPGEKGAFLIANSWGPNWGNKGLIWVAYDAFLSRSAVSHGPSLNRVALADAMNSYVASAVPLEQHYAPKIIAKFSLSQVARNQINVAVGISDATVKTPQHVFKSYAAFNQGGNWRFDGTTPRIKETATFALDLTDLIPAVNRSSKRFYLIVCDNKKGDPTTIESFEILDGKTGKALARALSPVTFDGTCNTIYIDMDK